MQLWGWAIFDGQGLQRQRRWLIVGHIVSSIADAFMKMLAVRFYLTGSGSRGAGSKR
jgi:hypothetical protein